jgi:hypothetical protein
VIRHRSSGRDVIAAHHVDRLEHFVRRHADHGDLVFHRLLKQRPLPLSRFRDNQAVDAFFADPTEHHVRIVVAPKVEARQHQAGVVL